MAFSFAGATPAAPAAGGFSFGAAAPAAGGGGLFVSPTAVAAAPPPAFGAPPAAGGFPFGGTAAAPAAPTAFGFGGISPGQPQPQYPQSQYPQQQQQQHQYPQQQQQQPAMVVAGSTPYSQLPAEYRRAIDELHESMMRHKRSMNHVQSMAPKALLVDSSFTTHGGSGNNSSGTSAGATATAPLQTQMASLGRTILSLQQDLRHWQARADANKVACETSTQQAYLYGRWPVEAVAVRRGVRLQPPPHQDECKDADTVHRVRQLLDQQLAHVDRVERMPSPYMWQVLAAMNDRLNALREQAVQYSRQLEQQSQSSQGMEPADVVSIVETQHRALCQVSNNIQHVHVEMQVLRHKYSMYEREDNVLQVEAHQERERQRKLDDQIQRMYVQASQQNPQQQQQQQASGPGPPGILGQAPAGGLFGASPAPAPSGFGFGAAPNPAPAGGGLFGNPAAPAAGGSGLFGSAPAPAAVGGGGLFGAASTPAAGGVFGAAPAAPGAAAPASAFGNFGSTSTFSATPKKKSGSRSSGRLKR